MSDQPSKPSANTPSRRQFLRTGSAVGAAMATGLTTSACVRGAEPLEASKELVRIGLVGAGGRGGGAANDTLDDQRQHQTGMRSRIWIRRNRANCGAG